MNRRFALSLLVLLGLLALSAPGASASLVGFQSEDGKVGCYANGKGVRCDVKKPKWDPPPPPADCDLDWGQGVVVSRKGPAEYVCAGDTTLDPGHDVLESGDKIKTGRFKCKALNESLIKCVNTRNREGFEVSRFEVHLFE
jgi:hypothetical protein